MAHGPLVSYIKTFQGLILEKIHIHVTVSYTIKFLVNIWNHGKNYTYVKMLRGQNPCKNGWTVVTFDYLSLFSWTKTIISIFSYFKDYYIRNMIM